MSKTITLRIDDEVYKILKTAANGEKRTISNFIEFAALITFHPQHTFPIRKWRKL